MLEKYIPKRFATAMIKHVIAATLFFPYFYTKNGNPAYADFVLANFFAILTMVFILTSWKLDFKRNAIFVTGLSILLVAYNVCATYMNVKYHHWYGEQINTSIAFLLFIVLLLVKDIHALIDTSTIKAIIHMIIASNVLAILFRVFTGYNQLRFMNDWVQLTTYPENLQIQFAWLYSHKSEYGLLMVLCVAFCVVYKKHFQNIFTYALSLGVLLAALYLSDSYTALGVSILIFAGQFLDFLVTAKWWKKLIATVMIPVPVILIAKKSLQRLGANRNLLNINGRTIIWKFFVEYIKEHPHGTAAPYGSAAYYLADWAEWGGIYVNNAHNVFLNHMLRFSLLVGIIFFTIFMIILLFSIKKYPSFTTLCIWIALLIPMMMDDSLTSITLSHVVTIIFMMFFIKEKHTAFNKK